MRDWNNPVKAGRTSTKISAHSTATKRASGSPLGAIKAWKERMLTITGQHGHRQRYVTVDQQKYRCDDLKCEDHPQIVRGVQGTHELSRDAPRRGQGNEVQKAVQAENKKDHTCQVLGDQGSGSHNWILLWNFLAKAVLLP